MRSELDAEPGWRRGRGIHDRIPATAGRKNYDEAENTEKTGTHIRHSEECYGS
jgi:hypothetical protein